MRRPRALLGLVLLLGAGLRVFELGAQGFWLDELFALENSTGRGFSHLTLPVGVVMAKPPSLTSIAGGRPWWTIWTSLSNDTHPPLHFMLLRLWREAFGEGDVAARSLSVVASLAGLALLFLVARELLGPARALGASLLIAVAPLQIRYAQEARNYTMAQALCLGAALALLRIEARGAGTARNAALALCVLASLLTHYLAIPVAAVLALYALLRLRGPARRQALLAFFGAGLAFFLLWGPRLSIQSPNFGAHFFWAEEVGEGHGSETVMRFFGLPVELLGGAPGSWVPATLLGALVYLLPPLALRRRPELLLGWLWLTLMAVFLTAVDLARETTALVIARYTFLASPGLALLLAAGLGSRRFRQAPLVLGLGLCVFGLPSTYRLTKPEWREFAAFVQRGLRPGEVLVLSPGQLRPEEMGAQGLRHRRLPPQPRWAYLGVRRYLPEDSPPILVLLEQPARDEALARLCAVGTAWLLTMSGEAALEMLPGAHEEEEMVWPTVGTVTRVSFTTTPATP